MSPSPHEYLRHMHYFGVDYRIVWDVATTKLPGLGEQLRQLLTTGSFLPL